MHALLVGLARAIFGFAAAIAVLGLFAAGLVFDAPGSTESTLTWCFAASPIVYLVTYAVFRWKTRRSVDAADRLVLRWAILPLLGLAWVVTAIVALQVLCDGKFACRH